MLNDFGLSRAISNFINKLPRGEMRIVFETNLKNERFDTDIEVILYRVVCELINNSLKHSEAARVDLSLHYQQGQIRIRYKDNGCGFDPDKVGQKGMGISNIFSRISSLKGTALREPVCGRLLTFIFDRIRRGTIIYGKRM